LVVGIPWAWGRLNWIMVGFQVQSTGIREFGATGLVPVAVFAAWADGGWKGLAREPRVVAA
jgi:hypothetical protein